MSVYGTVIVSVTLTPIGFLLQNFPNVQYGIIGIMILLSTSVILGLIFVTKVAKFCQVIIFILFSTQWYKVYQDPEGKYCLEESNHTNNNTVAAAANCTDENYYKSRIASLNEEIIALNKKNKALNDELAMVSVCKVFNYSVQLRFLLQFKCDQVENTAVVTIREISIDDTA